MKIKMFYDNEYTHESIEEMEGEINAFIENKNVIDIKTISEGAENGHSYTIIIIYEEANNRGR